MNFTLVSTVFNEAKRLEKTIDELKKQTLKPTEIIITDAGSTDGTYEMLQKWKSESDVPVIILQKSKCNVAEGRDLAIRQAKYDLIASMDFGCRFDHRWLQTIISPFSNPAVKIVGGAFTVLEDEQISLAAKAAFVLENGYKIDVHNQWFYPSSRSVAYYKEVFDKVGGYCEWLTLAGDDLVFGMEVKARGYKIDVTEEPYVFWGRHSKAIGYAKEGYRYGLGEGEARINFKNFTKNGVKCGFRFLFFIGVLFLLIRIIIFNGSITLGAIALIIFLSGFRIYLQYIKLWFKFKSPKYNLTVLFYGFYLIERVRINHIKGYIKGYFFSTKKQKMESEKLKYRL